MEKELVSEFAAQPEEGKKNPTIKEKKPNNQIQTNNNNKRNKV
jgi:hypothetical protein